METRRTVTLTIAILALLGGGSDVARASSATFDNFKEGFLGTAFVDGGITFLAFESSFAIDGAVSSLNGECFSAPNVLQTGGFNPGPGINGLFIVRPFSMTNRRTNHRGSIDAFLGTIPVGASLTMTAFLDQQPVGSDTVFIEGDTQFFECATLSISGVIFDTLQIAADGVFAAFDNAHLGAVGDANDDDAVDVDDLLLVLGAWGPCPAAPAACPADLDESGVVDVGDLIEVVMAWGS